MALKGDMHVEAEEIRYICNDVTERGVILTFVGTGSGNLLDQGAIVTLPGTGVSGLKPAGLLLNDFVDIDESKYHVNYQKGREQQVGSPAQLMRRGWAVTNKTAGTPAAGSPAYLAASGKVSTTQASGAPQVGTFLGSADENSFACVEINL